MTRIILSYLLLLSCSSTAVEGFVIPQSCHQPSSTLLNAKKSKGFGAAKEATNPKPKSKQTPSPVPQQAEIQSQPASINPFPEREEADLSLGKAALEKMRRERAEQRNAELRKIKELKETDAMLQESSEAAVIPERVAQRMGNRMLLFVGIPLFGSLASFVGFWYMATYRDMEFQPALVAASTIALLAVGLVGITYSIMSTSWDEDRDGSVLGTDEFSKNLDNIKEGLSRTKENAVLRDKMYDYSPEEIANVQAKETAKEAAKEKRQQSFTDKFGNDLE